MKRLLPLFLVIICGCATAQFRNFPSEREQRTTRTYTVTPDRAFDATVNALEANGYAISDLDRANGLITTAPKSFPFGVMMFQKAATARISAQNGASRIRINITWEGEERYLWKDYEDIFSTIDGALL